MDQVELTTRDFLVKPTELVDVVRTVAGKSGNEHCRQLGEIAAQYASTALRLHSPFPPQPFPQLVPQSSPPPLLATWHSTALSPSPPRHVAGTTP